MAKSVSTLAVEPLTPTVGAELGGVDLRAAGEPERDAIRDALHEHLVVFFRDQSLDDRSQRAFAARFGEPQPFPFAEPTDPTAPEVHAIGAVDRDPRLSNSDTWHSDATFMAAPPMGTVLRAVRLPSSGGDTLFANMYAAYEALSSRVQRLIEGMTARHDVTKSSSHHRPVQDRFPPVDLRSCGPTPPPAARRCS
jgi:taurine dioxygenase